MGLISLAAGEPPQGCVPAKQAMGHQSYILSHFLLHGALVYKPRPTLLPQALPRLPS